MGRPTRFNDKTAERICARLMRAESLRRICKSPDMPSLSTVCNWLATKDHPFLEQYARARRIQAELLADEIIEIADNSTNDFMERERENGTKIRVFDHEHVQRSKLRLEARKWVAAKLLPKKYGDRNSLELTGHDGGPIAQTIRPEMSSDDAARLYFESLGRTRH
jgi:hypothetical protein